MDSLDLLEKRIESLSRILGPLPDSDIKGAENFADTLISANTLISSALSGRENITKVVNRSDELESYLDPQFLEEHQDTKAKEVYVNTVAPELAGNFELLDKIKTLETTLGAEYFRNIPDVTDKLTEMSNKNAELKQSSEIIEESLILAMQRYSEIQKGITDSLRSMNDRLDKIEEKMEKKNNLND